MKRRKKNWPVERLTEPRAGKQSVSSKGTCHADCLTMLNIRRTNHAELIVRVYKPLANGNWSRLSRYLRKRGYTLEIGQGIPVACGFFLVTGSHRRGGMLHTIIGRGNSVWWDGNCKPKVFAEINHVAAITRIPRKRSRDVTGIKPNRRGR